MVSYERIGQGSLMSSEGKYLLIVGYNIC